MRHLLRYEQKCIINMFRTSRNSYYEGLYTVERAFMSAASDVRYWLDVSCRLSTSEIQCWLDDVTMVIMVPLNCRCQNLHWAAV